MKAVEKIVKRVKKMRAVVVGCGGLGCNVVEHLARMGVSHITLCDGDVFNDSNLNRQLYAAPNTIGMAKTAVAKARIAELDSRISVSCYPKIDLSNIDDCLSNCDIAFDCTDNTEIRLLLERACADKNIVIIHGAINGVLLQVAAVFPGHNTLSRIYSVPVPEISVTLSHVPALTAALMVNEGVKVFSGITRSSKNVLSIDLLHNDFLQFGV